MMAKQPRKGTIVQLDKGKDGKKPKSKCRKWKLVVSLGLDPATGKYPQKAKRFYGSYSEAEKELRSFVEEIEGGTVVRKSTWTFNEYAERFMKLKEASGELAAKTLKSKRGSLAGMGYAIGHMKLQDITPSVIENAELDMRNGKSRSGRKLSGTTMRSYHSAASEMMDHAKKAGVIGVNPFDEVQPPRYDTKEKGAMTGKAYGKLLDKLDPTDGMEIAVLLCATLGLRRGEACGLSWGDIDFEENTVFIQHSYDDFDNLKAPKTDAGKRILPLPDFTRNALIERKAAQIAMVDGISEGYTYKRKDGKIDLLPEIPVATSDLATRIHPQKLSSWWFDARESFGAKGICLHQLRHTFLSLAAEQGIHPSVMQKLAGHSNPTITMKIYTHVNVDAKKAAIEALQNAYMTRAGKAS